MAQVIYDFVFIVQVYRNTEDLEDFFHSLGVPNAKVIVVNSFYDEASESDFRKLTVQYAADFISVPNKGYGAGNNVGVKHAQKHYSFKYLIISNADIKIEKLNVAQLEKYGDSIIATRYGESEKFSEFVLLYSDRYEFAQAVSNTINQGVNNAKTAAMKNFALNNTWKNRVLSILDIIKQ